MRRRITYACCSEDQEVFAVGFFEFSSHVFECPGPRVLVARFLGPALAAFERIGRILDLGRELDLLVGAVAAEDLCPGGGKVRGGSSGSGCRGGCGSGGGSGSRRSLVVATRLARRADRIDSVVASSKRSVRITSACHKTTGIETALCYPRRAIDIPPAGNIVQFYVVVFFECVLGETAWSKPKSPGV